MDKPGTDHIDTASVADDIDVAKAKATLSSHDMGDVVLVSGDNEVRRIPIPTDDPNDPLNFHRWRKLGIVVSCCWFSVFSLLCISGIGTFMNTLYGMYMPAHSAEEVTSLSTYPSMVMAFGSIGLLPLAFVVGRRPIFLGAVSVCLITALTAGSSSGFEGHFISRIFMGLATGVTESLLPLIISDATYLSERSFYFGLYWSIQNGVNAALLVSLSYLTANLGWRWYYWLFSITLGASLLSAVFFLPETRFQRPAASLNGQVVYTDEFGATHILSDADARERFGDLTMHVDLPASGRKRTFMEELKPWSPVADNGFKIWTGAYVKMAASLTSPGVWFAMLAGSISLGIAIAITLIYSALLEDNYGWSPASVGLFNIGTVPGSFLAMLHSGWFAGRVNLWLARRNGGVHKPEHHLIHLIIPYVTSAVAIIVFAVCANNPEKYSAWALVIAWAIYEFSFTCIIITVTTFAAEVFPDNPGAAMVPVIGGKNIISFGAAYGLIPMLAKYSYLKSFLILWGIFTGIFALGIPVYFLDSKWKRANTRKS